jgi:hypothetical protein
MTCKNHRATKCASHFAAYKIDFSALVNVASCDAVMCVEIRTTDIFSNSVLENYS